MKYEILPLLLLFSSLAYGSDQLAACELSGKSVISRAAWELPEVSNVGDIRIICRVPARPFPSKPGEIKYGLTVATKAYEHSSDGTQNLVPSEARPTAGGTQYGWEWVEFYVHIPLEAKDRDEEAGRYLAKLEAEIRNENVRAPITPEDHERAMERIRELLYQHRLGQFQLECQVFDGDRVLGTGVVDLEILFKGRFSDLGLPGAPPV